MAQTPQEFFNKNLKWITIVIIVLSMFGAIRSCNNNMGTRITDKKNAHTIDSLLKKVDILERQLELCKTGSKIKDDFIDSYKLQKEAEYDIRRKEAEKKVTINNNITIPKDTTTKGNRQ